MGDCKAIAIMTSGGDAPGMNAAIRGVVRACLNEGWKAVGVRDAFKGLAEGGDAFVPLDWSATGAFFREGGTHLGSARFTAIKGDSPDARSLKVRALENLRERDITGLVVIGGDGSLTGARDLWQFLASGQGPAGMRLSIVGIPGSIDNDIPRTDMSIGVDTTLNTIVECIDKLRDTATSHKRISIVEVMGRLRGYLAVMSGLATGADRIFIREQKVSSSAIIDLLGVLQQSFGCGQQAGIVIRSEGAEFSTTYLKETVATLLEPRRDVRETILGHLQRGGSPSAFERVLAMRMGVKAVEVLKQEPAVPVFVGIRENSITAIPLEGVLQSLNDTGFRETLSGNALHALDLAGRLESTPRRAVGTKAVAVITDGNNVSGMNMAIRAVARLAVNEGMRAVGVKGGFEGLLLERPGRLDLSWDMLEMKGILRRPGSLLGVSHRQVSGDRSELDRILRGLDALGAGALVAIGNLHAYTIADMISKACGLQVIGIPADANCNLPGTNWVIGMDSALNDLVRGIDRAADAAQVQKKIYIIHLKWHYCYCLVHLAALAGGADQIIVDVRETADEDPSAFQQAALEKIERLRRNIDRGKQSATVVYFSRFPDQSDAALDFIRQAVIGSGIPFTPTVVPLETSYGGSIPTAFDRTLAQRFGESAFAALEGELSARRGEFHIVGFRGKGVIVNRYRESIDGIDNGCPPEFVQELQHCFSLMSQTEGGCVGIGGEVCWSALGQGIWTCRQCGESHKFVLEKGGSHWFHCENPACCNYGFISGMRN